MTAPTTASSTSPQESTEVDPRSPTVRLGMFFDDGEFELITPQDDRGVLVAVGRVAGAPCVAFATDPTVQGGAMGNDGCRAHSRADVGASEGFRPGALFGSSYN